jgi:nucleoside-diphosphate-sugar epimerase
LSARILAADKDAHVLGLGRSENLPGFFTHFNTVGGKQQRAKVPAGLENHGHYRYQQLPLMMTDRLREVIERFEPTVVFHLASALHTATDRELFEANIEGTASLMSAVAKTKALIVHGSSGSVYGEPESLPFTETQPCNPNDLYGITKLASEQIVRVKALKAGLQFITARIFNVVGPGQSERHVAGGFAAQLSASTRPSTLSAGTLETTRDFIDIRDVASALLLLALSGERGTTYNVASGKETHIHFILSELLRISGLTGQVEVISNDAQATGVSRHVAKTSRLRKLGFQPAYSVSQSLEDLFNYRRGLYHGAGL